jgi:hypothetical protein
MSFDPHDRFKLRLDSISESGIFSCQRTLLVHSSCQLAKNRLSNNVGSVKHLLSVPVRALRRARHFALVEDVPHPTEAHSQAVFRSGTQSDPCISSITTSTMILSSNSPLRRSGTPSQFLGVLLDTTAIFGLSRVRTESVHLLVIPFLAHHPVQLNG